MTDMPLEEMDEPQREREAEQDDLLEGQEGKGYGEDEDEDEREESLVEE
jgi:hypothetical protein